VPLPLLPKDGYLPDPNRLEDLLKEHRPRYCLLNFPSNPTSALCPVERLVDIVVLARSHGTILLYDNAYSEIYFDPAKRPPSILEVPGAKEVALELHSFSKTFNMTGWRLGFAVGNPDLVAGLLRAKTNIDSGPLLAVQEAAEFALERADEFCNPLRALYARRRAIATAGLRDAGIEYFSPDATFFIWARVPGGGSSMQLTRDLIEREGLVVTPGVGFGEQGEGFFRLALTVEDAVLEDAMARLRRFTQR